MKFSMTINISSIKEISRDLVIVVENTFEYFIEFVRNYFENLELENLTINKLTFHLNEVNITSEVLPYLGLRYKNVT